MAVLFLLLVTLNTFTSSRDLPHRSNFATVVNTLAVCLLLDPNMEGLSVTSCSVDLLCKQVKKRVKVQHQQPALLHAH